MGELALFVGSCVFFLGGTLGAGSLLYVIGRNLERKRAEERARARVKA